MNEELNDDEFKETLAKLQKAVEDYRNSINNYTESINELKEEYKKNTTYSSSLFDVDDSDNYNLSPVFVTEKTDSILDFINSCDDNTKEQVLEALKSKSGADKALFLTASKDDKKTYVVLMNISSLPEHEGLALAYSTDLTSLTFFLSELTTLTQDEIKESFGPDESTPSE